MKARIMACLAVAGALISTSCSSDPPAYGGSGNWTKFAGNPVLKPGRKTPFSPIGNDYYNLSDPCVIKDGGVYKMWYTSSGPTAASAVNHANISYAESHDGIEWVKFEGSPVLDLSPGSWDAFAVETVSVLIDASEPDPDRRYKAWYAGRTSDAPGNPAYDIGYAWSQDGKAWTKRGSPVLVRGTGGAWDNRFLEGPTVIMDGGLYKMWYAAMDGEANEQASDGKVCIGYAESTDGLAWSKIGSGPVVMPGVAGAWDSVTAQDPCALKIDGTYYLWYGGKSRDTRNYGQQSGFAWSSDGLRWTKSPSNPVLARGASGDWDAATASYGAVILDGDALKIWYTGMDADYDPPLSIPAFWEIGYASRAIPEGVVRE